MTDWPASVQEYEKHADDIATVPGYSGSLQFLCAKADAAIRDLKEGWSGCREKLRLSNAAWLAEKGRREQAEAEVARLQWMLDEAIGMVPEDWDWEHSDYRADLERRWELSHNVKEGET